MTTVTVGYWLPHLRGASRIQADHRHCLYCLRGTTSSVIICIRCGWTGVGRLEHRLFRRAATEQVEVIQPLPPDTGVSFPPKSVSTPTQASMFLQKCLYADTGVCDPPKVSLRQHRCLFSSKIVSRPTQMSLFHQKCLFSFNTVSIPSQVSFFIPKVSLL